MLDAMGADEETRRDFEEAFGSLEDRLVEDLKSNPSILDEAIAAGRGELSF